MALVDQFGQPISFSRFLDAAQQSNDRPAWPTRAEGIKRAVNTFDWRTIVSASRRLFGNMGVPRGAIGQKATFATVGGWLPIYRGRNKKWGKLATQWLTEQWYPVCELRGGAFDFVTTLKIDSETIDKDGGFGVLLTKTDDGFPLTQRLPIHRFGNRYDNLETNVTDGPYKGLKIHQGIIYNLKGRPVAYRIYEDPVNLDVPASNYQDISARNLIHVYDPEWYDQGHGFPAFTFCLNDLRDMKQSKEWEQLAMLQASSIGLIEFNESGQGDPNDPAVLLNGTTPSVSGVQTMTLEGGMYRYFRANSGSKLEALTTNRPSDTWDRFNDRLTRSALLGINWPYSLAWKTDGGGTDKRADIALARSSVTERQGVMKPYARRIVQYAISNAMPSGIDVLPFDEDWYMWDFAMPAKLGIDDGRDGKQRIENLKYGVMTFEADQAERGMDWEKTRAQQEVEVLDLLTRAKRISEASNVPLETALALLQQITPNQQISGNQQSQQSDQETEE